MIQISFLLPGWLKGYRKCISRKWSSALDFSPSHTQTLTHLSAASLLISELHLHRPGLALTRKRSIKRPYVLLLALMIDWHLRAWRMQQPCTKVMPPVLDADWSIASFEWSGLLLFGTTNIMCQCCRFLWTTTYYLLDDYYCFKLLKTLHP